MSSTIVAVQRNLRQNLRPNLATCAIAGEAALGVSAQWRKLTDEMYDECTFEWIGAHASEFSTKAFCD